MAETDDNTPAPDENEQGERQVAPHANNKHHRAPQGLAGKGDDIDAIDEDGNVLDTTSNPTAEKVVVPEKTQPSKGAWGWVCSHKAISIPLAIVVVLVVLGAIPVTRFALAGLVWKQTQSVAVIDSQTHLPVTGAQVTVNGQTFIANAAGVADVKVAVGSRTLTISKKYFKSTSQQVTVPILKPKSMVQIKLVATGRQVPITVLNTITGKPIAGVTIKGSDTDAVTGKAGQVTLVLPADKAKVPASLSLSGYNSTNVTVTVTASAVSANTFKITPTGTMYFLSNASGKIDVVKSNLDGTNRQTVVAGTGNESPNETVLLAARDWRYLALYSVRKAGGNSEINLIDTTNGDHMTNIDAGSNASFTLVGWQGHDFVYLVDRTNYNYWQPARETIKSYNAENGKITALYNTSATGSSNADGQQESVFGNNVRLVGSKVIFATQWYAYPGYNVPGKQNTLNVINTDGSGKKVLATLDSGTDFFNNLIPYEANSVVSEQSVAGSQVYYEYDSGGNYNKVDPPSKTVLNGIYPTYLISPSGNQTFWAEQRDGKNLLQVGDADGKNAKTIATASDYNAYGWYTDQYILESKNSSELYILPASGLADGQQPFKIGDYFKPQIGFNGYGGGYGGQ